MNSLTDTSIDPVGLWARSEDRAEGDHKRETHGALGMDWPRSDAPLNKDDGFGWDS